ncbi:hypothetical protein F8M41_016907 [Gigaspora margarita]|uniref:Uncharacterized protein n=1 Tax=Gigaspora margarita TaxID=4874 RepID=A0A8H4ANU8_GIGMA|nr:hypothetical protein F8M41_016907 [Gigaspora margarita]
MKIKYLLMWLLEGVIKLLKSEKDYEKEFCKIDDEEKKENENRTFLEGCDVIYERKANHKLITVPSLLLLLPRSDEKLKEDKQFDYGILEML